MPLVKIYLRKGKPHEYVAAIGEGVHGALVAVASVPADDRFQIFHELDADHLVAHASYGGVERSEDLVVIEITLNQGRSLEVKRQIYAEIAARLGVKPGVRPDDVLVSLVEVTKENWSFGGGIATYG